MKVKWSGGHLVVTGNKVPEPAYKGSLSFWSKEWRILLTIMGLKYSFSKGIWETKMEMRSTWNMSDG